MSRPVDRTATAREVTVESAGIPLAGSWWMPEVPIATVVMHPGSGPSDRDNDVYFPPIRDELLAAGIGVASFDKRGVGGSGGRWQDAGIVEQADDALAAVDRLVELGATPPLGLFGHSQGGWVVVEAAAGGAAGIEFVVTNAGPGVSPAEQDRYAMATKARAEDVGAEEAARLLELHDEVTDLVRRGGSLADARTRVEAAGAIGGIDLVALLAEDEHEWAFMRRILDHDPRPAMRRLAVPVLALFGADDRLVPVRESVDAYLANVDRRLITVTVFAGANHRVQCGEPPAMADGYVEMLVGFIAGVTVRAH